MALWEIEQYPKVLGSLGNEKMLQRLSVVSVAWATCVQCVVVVCGQIRVSSLGDKASSPRMKVPYLGIPHFQLGDY